MMPKKVRSMRALLPTGRNMDLARKYGMKEAMFTLEPLRRVRKQEKVNSNSMAAGMKEISSKEICTVMESITLRTLDEFMKASLSKIKFKEKVT